MRLTKAQRVAVLEWIAEGLETDEINKRAARHRPAFKVSRRVVAHYRKSRDVNIQEIKEASESDALKSGLALKENRVAVLQRLADLLISDLLPADESETSKLWLDNKKAVGFETYSYKVFNKTEVDGLRDTLDDIALEVGERIRRSDITSGGKELPTGTMTVDQVMQKINQLIETAKQRKKKEDASK